MSSPGDWENYIPHGRIFGDESRSWLDRFKDYVTYQESNEYVMDKIHLLGSRENLSNAEMAEWYQLWEDDPSDFWAEWRSAMGY